MITISILALKNATIASIADCRYIFTMVNRFLEERQKEPLFIIQLVADAKEVSYNEGLFSIKTDKLLKDIDKNDLIIIPVLTGAMINSVFINKEYVNWINQQYKEGVEIASLCSGVFLLAFSGLLKGKQCTTHWKYANELKHFYPSIDVVDEKVITDQHGLYSSGGSNAYWNLLLHLGRKICR